MALGNYGQAFSILQIFYKEIISVSDEIYIVSFFKIKNPAEEV